MSTACYHHRYMSTLMLEWPDFPDTMGENYCLDTVAKIKTDPEAWLCSLPMYEYAHVLTVFTAHHLGGEPTQYITILHNRMLAPILKRYYNELEIYRFNRAVTMRHYANMAKFKVADGATTQKRNMSLCTAKVRDLICQICQEYKWMKDLGPKHPKVMWMCQVLENMTRDKEVDDWMNELNAHVKSIKDLDVTGYPGTTD